MTIQLHAFLQTFLTMLQAVNMYTAPMPQIQPYVALALGVTQATVAFFAHFRNPDGTPAAQPYTKPVAQ
jgi:hypothetical protein